MYKKLYHELLRNMLMIAKDLIDMSIKHIDEPEGKAIALHELAAGKAIGDTCIQMENLRKEMEG